MGTIISGINKYILSLSCAYLDYVFPDFLVLYMYMAAHIERIKYIWNIVLYGFPVLNKDRYTCSALSLAFNFYSSKYEPV